MPPKLPQLKSWDECMKNCRGFCKKSQKTADGIKQCQENCVKFCDGLFPEHKKKKG